MKRLAINLMLLGSLIASPALVGCDRTVSEEKTSKTNSDGTSESQSSKTVQKSDGTVEKTTETHVDK